MNPFVFGSVLIITGLFSQVHIITGVGVLAVFAGLVKRRPSKQDAVAPMARPMRHKLLDAPANAWDEEPWFPYLAMTQASMGGFNQMDPLGGAFASAGFKDRHVHDIARNMLPFSHYGRNSVVENIFFGLPLSMGAFLNPRK